MGYLETIGAYACKNDNYIDSVEKGCENVEPEREKGYLGWFLNLAECLEAYPSPRKGFTFNNVETRSVWLYDGANWRNTTQGNPFHLIYDIEHAGEVKKGYAQTFYYIPTEEDVRGGTITYHFLIDGKDMWVEVDVNYTSDIVFIEWNGREFVSRVRSLDDRVAYVDSGKVVDRAGNVVVDVADIENKINNGLKEAVKYTPETRTSSEKAQARSNIDAIGALAVLKPLGEDIVALERGGKPIYPYIVPSKIFYPDGKSVEQSIAEEQERATTAEQSLAQGLWELQGRTQSAASELSRRIEDEKNRAEGVEQELKGGLKEAVKYIPETKTSSEKAQARKNIGAVGVAPVEGNNVLEYNGQTIHPRTTAERVTTKSLKTVEDALAEKVGIATNLSDGGVILMDKDGQSAYPRTQLKFVDNSIGKHSRYGQSSEAVVLKDGETDEVVYPETKTTYVKHKSASLETVIDELDSRSQETKSKVDTFLADADTSAEAIDKLKELQEYIKNDETSASQMLGDIAQNRQDIAKEETRAKQVEMYLESQKADKTGYYENMSVGVSDNLSGRGESSNAEFSMRPSGGENKSIKDGTARINSIHGNSVVWNQQIDNTKWKAQYGEFVVNNGEVFIVNGTPQSDSSEYYLGIYQQHNKSLRPSIGDIILLICDYYPIGTTLFGLNFGGHNHRLDNLKENDWNNISSIFTVTAQNASSILGIALFGGSKSKELRFKNIKVVNLTKMFCKGNEPTTVEEFEALYGNMPDDYNDGTIIDNHTKAIRSTGVNAVNEYGEIVKPPKSSNPTDPKPWIEEDKIYTHISWIGTANISRSCDVTRVGNKFTLTNTGTSFFGVGFCFRVIPQVKYKVNVDVASNNSYEVVASYYDENKVWIGEYYIRYDNNRFTPPQGCKYAVLVIANIGEGDRSLSFEGISVHLEHTGYLNGKYFPYESQTRELPTIEGGLKSALNAYDEIRYNVSKDKWEYVKRIGVVDLGTLDWKAWNLVDNEVQHLRFRAETSEKFNSTQKDPLKIYNILNKRYSSISTKDTWNYKKGISMVYTNSVELNKEFVIYDGAYTVDDADKLKSDLSGVICYYELEEPIVTELDIELSRDYKVWDYGTEEAINSELSTPVKLNLNYGFNAVGQITDNTILIEELLARVAQLEAQIAQVNSVSDTNEEE